MARMNIDVGARSDGSAAAQAAFLQEMRLRAQLSDTDLKTAIERLKASKAQIIDKIAEGVEAGKCWAMQEAEYLDLKKVGRELKQVCSFKGDQIDAVLNDEIDNFLKFPALRDGTFPPGAKLSGAHFEHGFCVGVHEVWARIEDKI